jgi:HEAT repeat protein
MGFFESEIEELKAKNDIDGLIKELKYITNKSGVKAAEALGEIGNPRAIKALIKTLTEAAKVKDKRGTEAASNALQRFGKAAVEPLIKSLAARKVEGREAIALTLAELRDPRAIDPLIISLKDNSWFVRAAAAAALGKFRNERAIKPLIKTITNKDNQFKVRLLAINSLMEIGEAAVKPLIELKYIDFQTQNAINNAILSNGDKAIRPLIQSLADENMKNKRGHILYFLGEFKDKRAIEALIMALKDEDKYIRISAAKSLGKIGDKRALEPLTQALNDENKSVQKIAKKMLKKIELRLSGREEHSFGSIAVRPRDFFYTFLWMALFWVILFSTILSLLFSLVFGKLLNYTFINAFALFYSMFALISVLISLLLAHKGKATTVSINYQDMDIFLTKLDTILKKSKYQISVEAKNYIKYNYKELGPFPCIIIEIKDKTANIIGPNNIIKKFKERL